MQFQSQFYFDMSKTAAQASKQGALLWIFHEFAINFISTRVAADLLSCVGDSIPLNIADCSPW